jgi:RNA polymerase sigma-70 factor (ECF subfamily)
MVSQSPRDGRRSPPAYLFCEARAGSSAAFESLADHYGKRVRGAAYRLTGDVHDAHDVAQHVLTQLFLNIEKFEDHRSLLAWLNKVTLNRCQDVRRERCRQSGRPAPLPRGNEPPGPDDVALRRDLSRRVRQAVAALPGDYRAVVELHFLSAWPLEAVASELSIGLKTAKSLAWKGARRLRSSLIDCGIERELEF